MSTIDLAELVADVRRRLRASTHETAQTIAYLHDSDLLWLLANGWEPPAPTPSARPRTGAFVLTTEQFHAYQQAVQEAQEVKQMLQLMKASDVARAESIGELQADLCRRADGLRAMAAEWKPE